MQKMVMDYGVNSFMFACENGHYNDVNKCSSLRSQCCKNETF